MKYFVLLLFIVPVHVLAELTCPDGTTCKDGQTCCPDEKGRYGCCPEENALCCSDGQCCPSTAICVAAFHSCAGIGPGSNGSQLLFTPSRRPKTRPLPPGMPKNIPFSGAVGSCPDDTTCCPTGCCLEPNAVCCSDGKHCCPGGFICDVKRQKCFRNSVSKKPIHKKKMIEIDVRVSPQAMSLKAVSFSSAKLRDVVCPGDEYFCPVNNTCCSLGAGDWMCCPFPSASCCSDGKHCCPEGTICTEGSQVCRVTPESHRRRKKSLALPFPQRIEV